jgi:soluble lytic murein transglycosylase
VRWRHFVLTVVVWLGPLLIGWWWYRSQREHRYDQLVRAAAERYGVDPALVKAVIWRESWFQADARGRSGELGLMQVRSPAAGEWADAERVRPFEHALLVDPMTNTLAGTWYLSRLLRRYQGTDNPLPYALADYNAGRTHVLKWIKGEAETNSAVFLNQIGFPGTRRYVETVLRRYERYRPEFTHPPLSK